VSSEWPDHGTLVIVTQCDRLSYKHTAISSSTAGNWPHLSVQDTSRRKIYVNNRLIEAVDPLYLNPSARHSGAVAWGRRTQSRDSASRPNLEDEEAKRSIPTLPVVARFSLLPEAWMKDDIKLNRNQRHLFYHHGLSVLRAEREMEMTLTKVIGLKEKDSDAWWGGEIHVPPAWMKPSASAKTSKESTPKRT